VGYYFAAYCHEVHNDGLSIVAFNISWSFKYTMEILLTKKPIKVDLILASHGVKSKINLYRC
jgi:hypothetical protein